MGDTFLLKVCELEHPSYPHCLLLLQKHTWLHAVVCNDHLLGRWVDKWSIAGALFCKENLLADGYLSEEHPLSLPVTVLTSKFCPRNSAQKQDVTEALFFYGLWETGRCHLGLQ